MPELPEIIAHAERLEDAFAGSELKRFVPLHMTALKTFDPAPQAAVGRTLTATGHRGKYLYLHFDHSDDISTDTSTDNRLTFVVHLMQAGRLRPDIRQTAKPRGGMARWMFKDGRALLLTEAGTERRTGVWLVSGDADLSAPVTHLGPEADRIDRDELARRLTASSKRIHGFLRDQRQISGIGRLLANEILHEAQVSPFSNTARLHRDVIDRLHMAMITCIKRGLAAERKLDEMGRSVDRPNKVYHRVGLECLTCGDQIRAIEYRRYRIAYCAACQTNGKILADNTTSRFLK